MPLARGTRIGSYDVVELIGAGGMGEVYLARDIRLKRDVAVKVLPAACASDETRLTRLEREALLLASLNHPNIATLHGFEASDGVRALVMEFVEGDTLDDRLAISPVPLDATVAIARQLVDALDAAHERGVVHRDLKPANIKIRPDGTVKVLDFGLAKAFENDGAGSDAAPTLTAPEHTVIGTPAYMSPEQARGGTVDRRTDIWAFGCVLFEMLTSRRPFRGATTSDVIAAVLAQEPEWSALPESAPPALRRLVRRCLEKDTKRRLRDIADAREYLSDESVEMSPDNRQQPVRTALTRAPGRYGLWMAAAVAAISVALLATWFGDRESAGLPGETVRFPVSFSVPPPDNGVFVTPLLSGSAYPVGGAISPDGQTLAFTASDSSGMIQLWIRPIRSTGPTEPRALPGTYGAALPFWSPDGKALGFFGPGTLNRIDLGDTAFQELARLQRGRGASWSRGGIIVFAPALGGPLLRVGATGGEPQPATTLRTGQQSHRSPYFLPDGRHFLYYAEGTGADDSGVFVGDLDTHDDRRLLAADSAAVYAPPGHLLFVRHGTLLAQPFDAATRQTTGEPVLLASSIPTEGTWPAFSVSDNGVLTYRSGPPDDHQFAWFDRSGNLLQTIGPPGNYRGVDLSRDGSRVAVHRHDGDGGDIWVIEERGTITRVTSDPSKDNSSPAWSPDGTRIAYGSFRDGKWGLYQKRVALTDPDELLIESAAAMIPAYWSERGLVYWLFSAVHQTYDTYLFPYHIGRSSRDATPVAALASRFYEGHAQVSPNGRWIAYMSSETGQAQIHVRRFPSGDESWQVSTNGGVTPRWKQDGTELFYVTSYDSGLLMAVPVQTEGATFVAGVPTELFNTGLITPPHSTSINVYHTYAVSPNGKRFLIPRPAAMLQDGPTPASITVVLNWTAMLER